MNATHSGERWRPVSGYEGHYEVSDRGRVRSLDRTIQMRNGRTRRIKGKLIKPIVHRSGSAEGYAYVNLAKGGTSVATIVHRLVVDAFVAGGATNEVRHANGNRSDNTLPNLQVGPVNPIDRMWNLTEVNKETGCWVYGGALHRGYGRIKHEGQTVSTHRLAYRLLVGPLPDHLTIDHVAARGCRSKACWNPDHLEAVTTQENTRRRDSELERSLRPEREKAARCIRGHERSGSNVEKNGNCRACANELRRERRKRARLAYNTSELENR